MQCFLAKITFGNAKSAKCPLFRCLPKRLRAEHTISKEKSIQASLRTTQGAGPGRFWLEGNRKRVFNIYQNYIQNWEICRGGAHLCFSIHPTSTLVSAERFLRNTEFTEFLAVVKFLQILFHTQVLIIARTCREFAQRKDLPISS